MHGRHSRTPSQNAQAMHAVSARNASERARVSGDGCSTQRTRERSKGLQAVGLAAPQPAVQLHLLTHPVYRFVAYSHTMFAAICQVWNDERGAM